MKIIFCKKMQTKSYKLDPLCVWPALHIQMNGYLFLENDINLMKSFTVPLYPIME